MSDFRQSNSPLDWFRHWVDTDGDVTYLTQPLADGSTVDLSWNDVDKQARSIAAYLKAQNFAPLSQIAIMSQNCAEWIVTDIAIWMAGHVSVPLYPTLAPETVNQILTHSESKFIFVGKLSDWDEMKPGIPDGLPGAAFSLAPDDALSTYPHLQNDIIAKTEPLSVADIASRSDDDLATIVYTSGSTGVPKGVMHSFKTIAAAARGAREQVALDVGERMLSYLPLAHVAERAAVEMSSLFNRYHVFFNDSLQTFMADIQRAQPTIFFSVPRLWTKFRAGVLDKMPEKKLNRLLKVPILSGVVKKKVLTQLGLQDVRYAITGAAPLPKETLDWYRSLGLELLEGYGMSENFGYSHCTDPGDRNCTGTVGTVNPYVECRIADNGEIQVKSGANMLGYYKAPEKTAEEMTDDGWFKTGDRGEVDSEGRLKITGRTKELFKTAKGKYIAPAPIENKVGVHGAIEVCCVSGEGYGSPYCLIMLAEDAKGHLSEPGAKEKLEKEFSELRETVNAQLDHHEHLQFFAVVKDNWGIDNGFLTPTMKIKRNVLEETYNPMLEDWYGRKQPVVWQ